MSGDLAIVTVTFNSQGVLPGFLNSLRNQSHSAFRLYAIDNASSDGSADLLALEPDPRVVVIRNDQNVGFAEGSNQGILRALDDGYGLVLLLNNDTEFPEDFLQILVAAAKTQETALFAPKIYHFSDPTRIWFAGGRFTRWLGNNPRHIGEGKLDEERFSHEYRIDFITGCAMLVKAEVFRKIGLLDEQYFAYLEDADFCWRARRAGFSMLYVPDAHLYHKVSTLTGGTSSPFSIRMGVRNRVYFLRKHCGTVRFFTLSSLYFLFLIAKWILRRDTAPQFRMRVAAFCEGLRMRPEKARHRT